MGLKPTARLSKKETGRRDDRISLGMGRQRAAAKGLRVRLNQSTVAFDFDARACGGNFAAEQFQREGLDFC
jgi:hypothetical protein